MNTVSSLTPHSANERKKNETNTSRIEQIKNNILSTTWVDRTIRPADRADKSSDHNKRRTTDTIDHGLKKMIINGHECDMDTEKFTNLDHANFEICKFRNEIRRRANEKKKFLSDMGKSAEQNIKRMEELFALKKLLPERDAEVSNLRSTVSKCNTENEVARKIIENMQPRLSEADEAKEEAISVLNDKIRKIKTAHEETKARYAAYKNTCEGQARMIEELKIAKSDQELKLSHAEAQLKQSATEHASDMFRLRSEHNASQQDNSELKMRLLVSEKALEESKIMPS